MVGNLLTIANFIKNWESNYNTNPINMATITENSHHQDLIGFIWAIADKLRGPYRPPQYRRVMLPLIVLRRLDAVLKPNKQAVIEAKAKYEAMELKGEAFEKAISKVAIGGERKQFLYNTSRFTFQKLLDKHNIQIIFALGHAPFVESFNKTMKNRMMKYMKLKNTDNWSKKMNPVLDACNNNPHSKLK